RLSGALGENPRPGDGKPVRFRTDRLHEFHVFLVPVVMVVSDVAGGSVLDLARRMSVGVPDGFAFAVFVGGSLNLVGRRGHAPENPLGELALHGHRLALPISRCLPRGGCGEARRKRKPRTADSHPPITKRTKKVNLVLVPTATADTQAWPPGKDSDRVWTRQPVTC